MADEENTAADEIIAADKKRGKDMEKRISMLEDSNNQLREKNDSLESMLADVQKSLSVKPSTKGNGKSLWQELEEFFSW